MVGPRLHPILFMRVVLGFFALLPIAVASGQESGTGGGPPDRPKGEATSKESGGNGEDKDAEYLKPFPAGPHETELKEKLGSTYKVRRTDHFAILYNTEEEAVQRLMPRLEATYKSVHRFATQLEIKIKYPKEKLVVVFCSDIDEFLRRCKQLTNIEPRNVAGVYDHTTNCAFFFDHSRSPNNKARAERAAELREQAKNSNDPAERKRLYREARKILNSIDVYSRDGNRDTMQHEEAHQLLFDLGVHTLGKPSPGWFREGLARQFETPPGKMGAGINVINQGCLGAIRGKYRKEPPDLRAFVGDPEHSAVEKEGNGPAVSWALVRYLIDKRSKELPKYVELLNAREFGEKILPAQEIADFEKCFGKLDENFVKKWHAYIMGLPYRRPR